MAAYKVHFKTSVERDLATIPKKDLKKILTRIKGLAVNPRP
jgi:mRNA interferase RelE/StbE